MSQLERLLAELRESMERDACAGIGEIEVPAAVLLDALARHMGMTDAQRAELLGQHGLEFVESMLNAPVRLNGKN